MKAMVFVGPGRMVLEERATPAPGPGEAVVAVIAAGICGSDIHGYTGASGRRSPGVVMGHEIAGRVTAVGQDVDPSIIGTDVVVYPLATCGACDRCAGDSPQLCSQRHYIGIQRDGGFAEMVVVAAADLVPVPADMDPGIAVLAEPAAVALHAIARAPGLDGASVLVTGAGPIGMLMARASSRAGALSVVNTETSPQRRELAARLGLTAVDPGSEDWLELVRGVDGAGVDVVFEGVGVQASLETALSAVRPQGCVVLASGWRTVEIELASLVTREVEARGTFNFVRDEFEAALPFLAEQDAGSLITDCVPLQEAPAAFDRLGAGQGATCKTVVMP